MDESGDPADDLRLVWRDAARAAELAERLADLARGAGDGLDGGEATSHEIASLAEAVEAAATRTATTARAAASEALVRAHPIHNAPGAAPGLAEHIRD